MGYVYFIQLNGTNLFKIGVTKGAPQKRLQALQAGSPHHLSIFAVIPTEDPYRLEIFLHSFFANARVRGNGEWFELDPDTIKHTLGHSFTAYDDMEDVPCRGYQIPFKGFWMQSNWFAYQWFVATDARKGFVDVLWWAGREDVRAILGNCDVLRWINGEPFVVLGQAKEVLSFLATEIAAVIEVGQLMVRHKLSNQFPVIVPQKMTGIDPMGLVEPHLLLPSR